MTESTEPIESAARRRHSERAVTSDRRPPLDLEQAAAYLNVTERFMRRLVAERRIPFHKLGRLLRFRAEDLDAFLEAGRVEPPLENPLLRTLGGPRARRR